MNQLTPEQLDMIKRLQPLFREKMGEWKYGDEGLIVNISESFVHTTGKTRFYSSEDNILIIPKPIDWQNPERGCLGMLNDEAFPSLFQCCDGQWHIAANSGTQEIIHIAPDPFTALLMALVAQEGG